MKKRTKLILKRSVSLLLVCAMVLCSPATDSGLLKGIFPDMSQTANAAEGQIPDDTALDSQVVPDAVLLEYLKGLLAAEGIPSPTVKDLAELEADMVIPSGVGNLTGLGYARSAGSFDISNCTSVTEIAANEFNSCTMTRVVLPSSITKLGDNAFKECSKLTDINLNYIDWFGKYALTGCSALTDASIATMKTSLNYLGEGAFSGCTSITQAAVPVISSDIQGEDQAHSVPKSLLEGCVNLSKVTFYDTALQTISDKAFERTGELQFNVGNPSGAWSDSLPAGIAYINASAFSSSKIKSIDLSMTQVEELKNATFYSADLSEGISLPETLKVMRESVFARSNLTEIDMPNSVTSIGKQCFQYTKKLETLILSTELTTIPEAAFQGAGATNIVAEGGSNYNNDQSTDGDSTVLDVSFHEATPAESKLVSIEKEAFNLSTVGAYDNTFLAELTQLQTIGEKAFAYTDFQEIIIPSTVNSLGAQAFNGMYYLTDVIFEDGSQVKEIPEMCFGSNKDVSNTMTFGDWCLDSVQLPEGLERIGDYAFGHCRLLTTVGYKDNMYQGEVNFPSTLLEIGEGAFMKCATFSEKGTTTFFKLIIVDENIGINKVTIPDSVTAIGKAAFKECSMLEEMTIGNGVTEIPAEMCNGCGEYPDTNREKAYLLPTSSPKAVSNPDLTEKDYTPIEFIGLKKLTLSDNITTIGEKAFFECYALAEFADPKDGSKTIDLPESLEEIGKSSFSKCKSLTEVRFPTALKKIGESAFAEASQYIDEVYKPYSKEYKIYHQYYGLKTADFQFTTQLETIEKNAFAKTNLNKINFPDSLTKISAGICNGCYNLGTVTMSKDVTLVSDDSFKDCYRLSDMTIPFAAEWEDGLFSGAAANMNNGLTVKNTPADVIDLNIIVGRDNTMTLNCFKHFTDTTLTLTDTTMYVDDEQNDLLKYDSNEYISAKQESSQIILTGKKEGTAPVKVTGKIDLFNQNLNYSNMTISISQDYNINVTRLPIESITLASDAMTEIDGVKEIYLAYAEKPAQKTVTAEFAPADTTDILTWTVEDGSIAEVSDATVKGGVSTVKITPLAIGDTILSVSSPTTEETCKVCVRVPAKSIKLTESSVSLDIGVEKEITADITYATELEKDAATYPERLVYSSSDESVVTVDPNTGKIKTVGEGKATITVKALASGKTVKCSVTVKAGFKPTVKSVTIENKNPIMNVGSQLPLTATVLPAEADQTLSWSSSDEKIATVANGVVTAYRAGTVTITATGADNKKATVKVLVKSPAQGLKIRGTNGSTKSIVVKKGAKITLSKFFTNSDCTDTFKFTAKKSKAGSITEDGVVTAKKPGKIVVTLTAYDGETVNATAKFTVKVVKKKVKAKKVNIKGSKSVLVDNRICLSATTKPGKATSTVSWSSSNPSIAKIDSYGVVTGLKPGKVKITAKVNGKKKKVTITVK